MGVGFATLQAQAPNEPIPAAPPQPPTQFGGDPMRARGPGGPPMTERKLVKQFDVDADKRLNKEERTAAREFIKKENANRPARGRFPGMPPDGRAGPGSPPVSGIGPGGFPPGPPGFGPGFGQNGAQEPAKPGARVSPADVPKSEVSALYAPNVLRTFFIDFESDDWEEELADFNDTDVDVPATLTVDGEKYRGVGVHFRGMSSYMMVPTGRKRSLNVALDLTDKKQRIDGYKTLNLLNGHEDASLMNTVLYSEIARHYLPAPKANLARVVINGEDWGIYTNVQQFNKDFLQENFRTEKGARWKVKGSPMGAGGLEYLGEDLAEYKRRYDMKTEENEEDWRALVNFCKVLKETPAEKLEEALKPIADIDHLLWFLALDCALINCDGYWIRASDFSIYRDKDGKFHFIPHDMNEAFRSPQGPGMGRPGGFAAGRGGPRSSAEQNGENARPRAGASAAFDSNLGPGAAAEQTRRPAVQPGDQLVEAAPLRAERSIERPEREGRPSEGPAPGGAFGGGGGGGVWPPGFASIPTVKGVELDPLVGLDDERKPLRSRVLAVPALRARYLAKVRLIAEEWLDWKKLGPIVAQYRSLIAKEVETETRGLTNYSAFLKATADEVEEVAEDQQRRRREMSLRSFADQRRAYLMSYPEIQKLPR
jgi:hypothetical protein